MNLLLFSKQVGSSISHQTKLKEIYLKIAMSQQVGSYISHQTKLKKKKKKNVFEDCYVPATALIGMHYFYQYIYFSYVRTMSTIGPEFNLKCLFWVIQTILPGSLNDQRNTSLAHLEQNTSFLLSKLTKWGPDI